MIVKYFEETDTLYIQFSERAVDQTRDLEPNMVLDLDAQGRPVAITVEHAKKIANVADFSFQRILPKSAA